MAAGGKYYGSFGYFGSLPGFCCYLCICFSLHVEAPIKTEADILVADEVLPSNTPRRPSPSVKVTVRKYESRKKSFKKTNPKRKKDYHNYQSLFEPRTRHPYLLEMVNDFSLHSNLCSSQMMKVEPLGFCMGSCVCVFKVYQRHLLLEDSFVYLNFEAAFGIQLLFSKRGVVTLFKTA